MSTTAEAQTRLINQLFGSGLTLAAVLSLPRLDREVGERVRSVVEQLDAAIAEVHHLALAAVIADERAAAQHGRPHGAPRQPMNRRCISHPEEADVRRLCRFKSAVPLYFERA